MVRKIFFKPQQALLVSIGMCLFVLFAASQPAAALTPIPTPNPKPGSYGLEATKKQPPPKQGATITTPGSGSSFSNSPITVSGICPTGLLVQLYNNGVMVGSTMCENGSFSLQVGLFSGSNELSALVYDDLDQAGPASNTVTITYSDTHFTEFGSAVTLTSSYGRRSAPAGNDLGWPLQLSGGTGPYAFNLDWGDGSKPELKSQSSPGVVTIAHAYKKAGVYTVSVTATDVHGVTAFLQVVAVSSGKVEGDGNAAKSNDTPVAATKVMWVPTVVVLILQIPVFWLGRKSQLVSMRNKMLKERDHYEQK